MKRLLMFVLALSLLWNTTAFAGIAFDGGAGSHLTISSSATDLTSNWTIAFWMKPVAANTTQGKWWARWTSSSANRQVLLFKQGGTGFARADIPFVVGGAVTGTTALSSTAWYHICFTRSGNTWTVYVNGVSDATNTNASTQESGGTFFLGEDSAGGSGDPFGGIMAEMAGWSAVLSAAEIVSLAKGTPPNMIRPANLAYYWPMYMLDGAGTTVADVGGAKWNGTKAGGLTTTQHAPTSPPAGAR